MAIAGADINNIGIKITSLFSRSVIINNIFAPDLILMGRSVMKSIDISYQIRWELGVVLKGLSFILTIPGNRCIFRNSG